MPIPNDVEFIAPTVTEGGFKSAFTTLLASLRNVLGTTGLAADARAALGLSGTPINYVDRGAWAAGTVYAIWDSVLQAGTRYYATVGHTAGSSFATDQAAGKWLVLQGLTRADLDALYNATLIVADGSDKSAAITAADAAGKPIMFVGQVVVSSAVTITVPISDTVLQVFAAGALVTIDNGLPVRPEWFGAGAGNIRKAVNALPATGGGLLLRSVTYPPSYDTADGTGDVAGTDYLSKPGITIFGQLPQWNSTRTGFIAGSGTIIQGLFAVFAQGFRVTGGIGVDAGPGVCTALYGGAAKDAFVFYQPNKAVPTYAGDVYIESIRGVCKGPTETVHAVLLEAADGGWMGFAEGSNAIHGVVDKSKNIRGGSWTSYNCGGEGVIFKSDDYANLSVTQVAEVSAFGVSTAGSQWGVLIQAVGAAGSSVQIGTLRSTNAGCGLQVGNGGQPMADVQIGQVFTEGCTAGYVLDGAVRVRIEALEVNNAAYAVTTTAATTSKSNSIGSVTATNISGDVFALSGFLRVGDIYAEAVTGYLYNFVTTAARILVTGSETLASVGSYWSLTTARVNSWVDFGSTNSAFSVRLSAGRVWLKGLIKSGTAAVVANLSTQIVPAETLRLTGTAYTGSAYSPAVVVVATDGTLSVTNYTAGSNYISLDGLSYPIPF